MSLEAELQSVIDNPLLVKSDRVMVRTHRLADIIKAAEYIDSLAALSSSATSVDANTAVMAGVKTNRLRPGGAV